LKPADEAAAWYARHGSEQELSPTETQEWEEWMSQPANSSAYARVIKLMSRLGEAPTPPLRSAAEVRGDRTGLPRGWLWPGRAALITAAACAIGALAWVGVSVLRSRHAASDEYVTAPAQHRQILLEDGSAVSLGGDSAIRLLYSDSQRSVLLERGEALFKVAHHPGRPFTVLAGGGRITALGTSFDVRVHSSQVLVGVTDGTVEVVPRDSGTQPGSPGMRLDKGQQIGFDFRGDTTALNRADTESIVAWTQGSITYRDRPLQEVIEDVQRYIPRRIQLDPAAAQVRFSGIFVEHDAAGWLELLPRVLPVEVTSQQNGIRIRLR